MTQENKMTTNETVCFRLEYQQEFHKIVVYNGIFLRDMQS